MPGLAVLLILTRTAFSQTPAPDRILHAIDSSARVALQGNVRPMARPEFDQGPVDDSLRLENITIVFNRSQSQEADLAALLTQQIDPHSPNFHHWLTPEEYADRFGLSPSDLQVVADWLAGQGFTVNYIARGRGWIGFSGTAAQVSSALHTEIHHYSAKGKTYYANASNPEMPEALARVVVGFRGLDSFHPHPMNVVRKVAADPNFTSYISSKNFLSPGDFAIIYDLNPLYNAATPINGTGQTIAVMGQTDFPMSDITTFRSLGGLPANNPTIRTFGPDPGTQDAAEITEADLDLEWSGAVAPYANIIYVNSNDAFYSLQYAIDVDLAPVMSVSYGACEAPSFTAEEMSLETIAQQANSLGITVMASSGDAGAADCNTTVETVATLGLAVDVPASLPNVTAMGGSEFDESLGPGPYWQTLPPSPTADIIVSALSYIPEMAWNDTESSLNVATSTSPANALLAGGGGASVVFPKPSWQTGVTPSDGARDVPDLAFNASPLHDGYLLCTQGSCVNGYRESNNDLTVAGGTSAGAPVFAGIVALIVEKTGSAQGNISPTLYAMAASSPSAFHDITVGNNIVPCQSGSPNCPTSAPFQFGFSAVAGYDQATGLGSVDAYNLVTLWTPASSSTLAAPALTSPANAATGVALSPAFSWSAVSGNGGYRIMIATAAADLPASASIIVCGACTVVGTTAANVTSYIPSGALAAGTYYWQVQAIVPSGSGTGAWSSVSSFTATGTLAAPTLTAPASGATGVPLPPTFTWSVVSGNAGYQIFIATSAAVLPSSPAILSCSGCLISATPSAATYTPSASALASGTTYFWEVQAAVTPGSGQTAAWSVVSSFTTGLPDFSLAAAPTSVTIAPGTSGAATVTVNLINNLAANNVTLACAAVPSALAGVTCIVGALNASNTATVTLTAFTSARGFPAFRRLGRFGGWPVVILSLGLVLILVKLRSTAALPRSFIYRQMALAVVLASLLAAIVSCGGGSGGGGGGGGLTVGPAESGTVTIQGTGTGPSITHTVAITVNVS